MLSNIEVYIRVDVLPLSFVFQQKLGQMIYKALKHNASPPLRQLLNRQSGECYPLDTYLRTRNPFVIPLIRHESCRGCLMFYGCRLWSHLDASFRDAITESSFVSVYRAYLMDRVANSTVSLCPTKFYDYV